MKRLTRKAYLVLGMVAALALLPLSMAPPEPPLSVILDAILEVEGKLWSNSDSLKNETKDLDSAVTQVLLGQIDEQFRFDALDAELQELADKIGETKTFYHEQVEGPPNDVVSEEEPNLLLYLFVNIYLPAVCPVAANRCAFTVEQLRVDLDVEGDLAVRCSWDNVFVDGVLVDTAAGGVDNLGGTDTFPFEDIVREAHANPFDVAVGDGMTLPITCEAFLPGDGSFNISVNVVGEKPQSADVIVEVLA